MIGLSINKKALQLQCLFIFQSFRSELFQDFIRHVKAVGRSLGQGTGKARAITGSIDILETVELKIVGKGACGIVFAFDTIKPVSYTHLLSGAVRYGYGALCV